MLERVVEVDNLLRAFKRVKSNKGAPGVDGMTVEELGHWLDAHLEELRSLLLSERYFPTEVRGKAIPKQGGGERLLGIPTVLDRLVQQALLQELEPAFDPGFSESSHGFRPAILYRRYWRTSSWTTSTRSWSVAVTSFAVMLTT